MPRTKLVNALTIVLVLLTLPAAAADQEDKWRLRIGGAWISPSVDFEDRDPDFDSVDFSADSKLGFSLAIERKISRRLGIELGALYSDSSFKSDVEILDDVLFRTKFDTDYNVITAGLNIHLTPGKATDLYIGPLFAYTDFGDIQSRQAFGDQIFTTDLRGSDDFSLGAQIGADIPLGKGPWGLNLSARYIDTSIGLSFDDGPETELTFDPLIFSAGASFRF